MLCLLIWPAFTGLGYKRDSRPLNNGNFSANDLDLGPFALSQIIGYCLFGPYLGFLAPLTELHISCQLM